MMQNVVITGFGAISVLGQNHEAIAQALYQGKSGIVADEERKKLGFRSILTGKISGFDGNNYANRKQRKSMPEFVQQAYAALRQAIEQANLPEAVLHSPQCGLIFGNDSTASAAFELAALRQQGGETSSLGSGHMFKIMNSTITMNLGVLLGINGGSWTVSAACASGLLAIGQAVDCIRLGRQEVMLCGGAQELDAEAISAFDGLGAFSINPQAHKASRPFDAQRDGLVPSGGAAALVLESEEHARKRGVPILGTILGWGYSSDGCELAAPSKTGLGQAMRMAMRDAHITPAEITEINAHATSTKRGDAAEAANIASVFGTNCPPVLTLKSLTGHEFWMAGAAQIVYASLMAQKGFCAGSPNFICGDAETAAVPVLAQSIDQPPRIMLCNAAGFGGSNASMVVSFL
jgi:3-oxoacyl-[acyl-carrier-protein] synthase-1